MNILHLDASARDEGSYSRALSRRFVQALSRCRPMLTVDRLDLSKEVPCHFGPHEAAAVATAEADHTPAMRAAMVASDALVARVLAANALVIGTPIYNFGMPSTLKAFFDHVSRNGKTFVADEAGMRGLLGDKKAVVLVAAGGAYGPGDVFEGLDALTPHVRAILGFMGIRDLTIITARPMMFAAPSAAQVAFEAATQQADILAERWATEWDPPLGTA